MFKNAVIFRLRADEKFPTAAALENQFAKARFTPCGATQPESFGWVPPRGEKHAPLVESIGGQYIMTLLTETKVLPGSVVKRKLKERLAKLEQETGRKPKGKWAKEVKEEVIQELLPKCFTKQTSMRVWVNPDQGFMLVEAGSIKKCDRMLTAFITAAVDAGAPVSAAPLNTQTSPAAAMATWLTTQLPPDAFTIDRELELKSSDGDKATVRYANHTLDITEVVDHIKAGKTPTKLALTHNGRVSFVLSDALSLKKVELLDVVFADNTDDADAGFDADVSIFTGEMNELIPAVIQALGGEFDTSL